MHTFTYMYVTINEWKKPQIKGDKNGHTGLFVGQKGKVKLMQ